MHLRSRFNYLKLDRGQRTISAEECLTVYRVLPRTVRQQCTQAGSVRVWGTTSVFFYEHDRVEHIVPFLVTPLIDGNWIAR